MPPILTLSASAALFDNDGVLVDSYAIGHRAWQQLASEFGFEIESFGDLAGIRAEDSLARLVPPHQLSAAVARLEDLAVEGSANTNALPGARELLDGLPPRRWTIATSASARLARSRWRAAGIPIPERFVAAADVSAGKPDPEPYITAANLLGADPARCIVFEDAPAGGAAAVGAGATVVAVGDQPWPFEPAARVIDLRSVTAEAAPDGLTLRLHP